MAQRVAGELYESITGQLFEIGRQLRQPNGYPFDPEELKKFLQRGIEGKFVDRGGFELYLHPKQKGGWIGGVDLKRHLTETGRLARAVSLGDSSVQGWIANPETYPEEYKRKVIFLWGSIKDGRVAYLLWLDGHVIVGWYRLDRDWHGDNPALLASS